MIIRYLYIFADGRKLLNPRELTFSELKLWIDIHQGLIKCKKVIIMEVEQNEQAQ